MNNGVMLQCFQWETPDDGSWWRELTRQAFRLHRQGITAVWLPPAFKGNGGTYDVGYGVYDLYDLGEFDQKGTRRTKYGTKDEYLMAIRAMQAADMQALADLVLNHRMGADGWEDVQATCMDWDDRLRPVSACKPVRLFTRFTFPGRQGAYSRFTWDASCFTGTDWDDLEKRNGIYLLHGKQWAEDVDREKNNYDYLMGADVDHHAPAVLTELHSWGRWYTELTGVDGFRLDAVKHISASFYRDWLTAMRACTGRELYAVGEYWHHDVGVLHHYLDQVNGAMQLFDVPLHAHLREASASGGYYDMGRLFEGTLVGTRAHQAVTFVDNHDTQPGQSLESWVNGWFKATAYGLILLRAYGYPCVFWGDLYGIPTRGIGAVSELPLLLRLRRCQAHGPEHDYFDHHSVVGFTREGHVSQPGSGLAFLCTNSTGGSKRMYVGKGFAGRIFRCVLGDEPDVRIEEDGCAEFHVKDGRCSVYVPRMTLLEALRRAGRETARWLHDGQREALWRLMHRK
ncbi:MAG: alpha-amylase [Aristaeellaceae bacterium]